MCKTDEMTADVLEVINVERNILLEMLRSHGSTITAEQLRIKARERIKGSTDGHNYSEAPDTEIEKYDE